MLRDELASGELVQTRIESYQPALPALPMFAMLSGRT
jgi:hypothetical protein